MATITTLVSFNGANGEYPSTLISDADGNLFGVFPYEGSGSGNAVFEIANTASGYASAATELVSFTGPGGNGYDPTSLTVDANGDLFGVIALNNTTDTSAVFEIANTARGYVSAATNLVTFPTTQSGFQYYGVTPSALAVDANGNLLATTGQQIAEVNDPRNVGTLLDIAKTASGYASTPTLLASFPLNASGGSQQPAGLIVDANGNLFGTTSDGGSSGYGSVFEIAKTPGGYASAPTVLASLNGTNGQGPGGLTEDANGDLFGTTGAGGLFGITSTGQTFGPAGTVFEIANTATGYASTPTVLANMNATVGAGPSSLLVDANGNVFGVATYGGANDSATGGDGTVFEIAKTASGYASTPTVLVNFNGDDGRAPTSLLADANGVLIGNAEEGGPGGHGTVYEVTNSGYQVGSSSTVSGGGALPNVQPYFTSSVYSVLQSVIAALTPASGTLNVPSVAAGGSAGASVASALNAVVVTTGGAASTVPAGYTDAYQFGSAATLQDANGGTALIGTVANATLVGAANDTIFGADAGETLIAQSGAETLYGGTGTNLIELGAATAQAFTQGTDNVVGSTQAATVTSAGNTTFFGASGSTVFNAAAGSATLVGGTGAETVNANAAPMLVFGATGPFDYAGGSGAGTVVGGVGSSASVTGGSAGMLYFGNGATTYTPGSATDTILGFTGSLTATGGANGTLFFTGTGGGNVVSTGAGSSTIFGFGVGDSLSATGAAPDIIAATASSETINAAGSSGSNSFFAFGQNDVVLAGGGVTAIQSGLGNQTLVGGTGPTLFDILGGTSRALVIQNFVAGQDFVKLDGYGSTAAAAALASATVGGAGTTIALIDGTQVTFQGVTGLTEGSFL